jgi:hypothetical protein
MSDYEYHSNIVNEIHRLLNDKNINLGIEELSIIQKYYRILNAAVSGQDIEGLISKKLGDVKQVDSAGELLEYLKSKVENPTEDNYFFSIKELK